MNVLQVLDDGSTVIEVGGAVQVVLKPGQWEQLRDLPEDAQLPKLAEFINANHAAYERTEAEERAMETAANAATGEAHQE